MMTHPTHEGPYEQPEIELQTVDTIRAATVRDGNHRIAKGIATGGLAIGALCGVVEVAHGHNLTVTQDVPFSRDIQTATEHIDPLLEDAGLSFPVAAGAIGLVQVRARRNKRLAQMDTLSSGSHITAVPNGSKNKVSRTLTVSAAITTSAAALGGFIGSIGTGVDTGNLRPIEHVLEQANPGAQSIIGETADIEPMVQSNLSPRLQKAIEQEASDSNIIATPFDLNLGSYRYRNNGGGTELTIATPVPAGSVLEPKFGCTDIPILIDNQARVPVGERIALDGVEAQVVGHIAGASSMNRIGVVTSSEALKNCIEQDPDAPDYGLMLNVSPDKAKQLLAVANKIINAPAAALSEQEYLGNSKQFWVDNVEALVGILALVSLGVAEVSMQGATRQRILQDRRYWAQTLSEGVSENFLRGTELLRAAKTGVGATVAGVVPAFGLTLLANTAIPGFSTGLGLREVSLGASVSTLGSLIGAGVSVIKPSKTIAIREETRS
jgi:hypothetical protein